MKKLLITVFLMIVVTSFAQIDTNLYFKEIRSLTNDSLKVDYWEKLYASDQDWSTFGDPVHHTINLVKTVYFFQIHGYETFKYKSIEGEKYCESKTHAPVNWIHCPSNDLSIATYPMIVSIWKFLEMPCDYSYFNQQLFVLRSSIPKTNQLVYLEFERNINPEINLNEIVELANSYINYITSEIVTLGKWQVGEYCLEINKKLNREEYYVDHIATLKLRKSRNRKFYLYQNNKSAYFKIKRNGDLIFIDEINQPKKAIYKQL